MRFFNKKPKFRNYKATFDPESRAAYIILRELASDEKPKETRKVPATVYLDVDNDNKLIGIEVLINRNNIDDNFDDNINEQMSDRAEQFAAAKTDTYD